MEHDEEVICTIRKNSNMSINTLQLYKIEQKIYNQIMNMASDSLQMKKKERNVRKIWVKSNK